MGIRKIDGVRFLAGISHRKSAQVAKLLPGHANHDVTTSRRGVWLSRPQLGQFYPSHGEEKQWEAARLPGFLSQEAVERMMTRALSAQAGMTGRAQVAGAPIASAVPAT